MQLYVSFCFEMNTGSGSSLTWHVKKGIIGVCTGIDVGFEQ